ncbi:hypothetical protein HH310_26785 [Actinoplanes sp. TBRC 11911]|uniref:hypothetical protein n=1 Tax=Actinoplanes sp. TBRC 11911 TaxID=2729386 RepID=UPI00145CC7B8|nr:hypothetical protein [Actinoplanes sp. TBRC 11911]NMO54781.1 hypothetical protein [Actinoplanes sp. TBRC 11911]
MRDGLGAAPNQQISNMARPRPCSARARDLDLDLDLDLDVDLDEQLTAAPTLAGHIRYFGLSGWPGCAAAPLGSASDPPRFHVVGLAAAY